MLLGVCQGQRTKREKMGRKMKCGKKEMQWTWLVAAVAQGQRKKGNERKGECGSDGSVPRSEEKNTIKAGGSTAICKMWTGWMGG